MADYDRYGTSSRSDVYVPMPVDRAKVGEKKIEKLQEEIERLENDQRKRKELIEKLTRMQEVEDRRSKQQDVISERFTRRRDLLLNEEMERVYGQNSPRVSGKSPAQMMDNLLAQRNREFSMKQKEKELETKYLVQERERLQQARERVREQRRNLLSPAESAMSEPDYHYRTRDEASPTVRGTPELPRQQSAHSVNGYVKRTIKEMPKTMDRITQLRQEVQKHYNVYVRPYRGEMGIHTYQPWQLKDYAMCRDIVESVVNEFLDLHFEEAIPMVEKETYYAIVDQRQREKEKNKETLSERRALQLEMEDILQEVTGEMALEVGKENRHTHGTVRNMTDLLMMNRAEAVVIDNEKGREINDPAYNVVTKHFYTTQTERDSTRNGIFYHSLDLELKQPGVPPVHRKKLPAQDQRLDTTKSKGKPPTRKQTPKKEPDVPGSQPKPPGPAPIVAPISQGRLASV